MSSASMAQSVLRCGALRHLIPSHPPLAASAVSSSSPLRSFHMEGESVEDFENSLIGDSGPNRSSFYEKLDRVGSPRARFGMGFDSLNDGMNEKLDQAACTFVYSDEIFDEDYAFKLDMTYQRGSIYSVKDLDHTKPVSPKYAPRMQFETTTE